MGKAGVADRVLVTGETQRRIPLWHSFLYQPSLTSVASILMIPRLYGFMDLLFFVDDPEDKD